MKIYHSVWQWKTRSSKRIVVWVALSIFLSGCMSSGKTITREQAASLTPGTSTEADVIARFGEPTSSSTTIDGTKFDMYSHMDMHANVASYVPIVNVLAGGMSQRSDSVTFYFDKNGILTKVTSSESHLDMNNGLLNQTQ